MKFLTTRSICNKFQFSAIKSLYRYKFLEYNRPPTTSSYRVRLRDNYSMDGTPVKEYVPTFDSLPPKSPTPQPPQLRMTGGNEFCKKSFVY